MHMNFAGIFKMILFTLPLHPGLNRMVLCPLCLSLLVFTCISESTPVEEELGSFSFCPNSASSITNLIIDKKKAIKMSTKNEGGGPSLPSYAVGRWFPPPPSTSRRHRSAAGADQEEQNNAPIPAYEYALDDPFYDSYKCATNSNEILVPSKPNETEVFWIKAITTSENTPRPQTLEDSGKWLIFESSWNVDICWERIRAAVEAGILGAEAKVSTTKPRPVELGGGADNHVICVFTTSDFEHREKVRLELFKLGFHEPLAYKTHLDSLAGNYKNGVHLFKNYSRMFDDAEGNLKVLYEGKFYRVKDKDKLFTNTEDNPSEWMFEADFKEFESNKENGVTLHKHDFPAPRPSINPVRSERKHFWFESRRKPPHWKIMIYVKQTNLECLDQSNPNTQLCWEKKDSKKIAKVFYELFRTPFDSTVKVHDFSIKGNDIKRLSVSLELKYSEYFDDYAIVFRGKRDKENVTVQIPLKDSAFCYKWLINKFS